MTLFFVTDRADAHVARFDALFVTLSGDYELVRVTYEADSTPIASIAGATHESWDAIREALASKGSVVVSGPLDTVSVNLVGESFGHVGISFATDVMVTAAQSLTELSRLLILVESIDVLVTDNYATENIVVVSPDYGRVRVAEKWADSLGGAPLAFIHKTRDPRVPNQVVSNRVVGEVEGKTCVLTDDMIDTGGTIAGAVRLLREDGAKYVIIAATHGVLSDPAAERLAGCGAREVVVTNTLPIDESKRFPQLTVLSIAPLLASTIRAVFENGSVTGLFDGDA